jgi:hypothetical protein
MSIVNTTKQLEADKASAGSTSINVIAPLAPNEEVTLVQKKPKKKKGKKQTVESAVSLNVPLEPPESLEDAKEMKEEIERIFDRLQEERNIMEENKSFDELLENVGTFISFAVVILI